MLCNNTTYKQIMGKYSDISVCDLKSCSVESVVGVFFSFIRRNFSFHLFFGIAVSVKSRVYFPLMFTLPEASHYNYRKY